MMNNKFANAPPPPQNPFQNQQNPNRPLVTRKVEATRWNTGQQQIRQQNQGEEVKFNKPTWIFCMPQCQPMQVDLNKYSIPQNQDSTVMFIINGQVLYIEQREFNYKGFSQSNCNQFDFSFMAQQGISGVHKAINFCLTGYAELNEGYEMTSFLISCHQMNVQKPIFFLQNYLNSANNKNNDYHIEDCSDLFFLENFISQIQDQKQNSFKDCFQMYKQKIVEQNPYFYKDSQSQGKFNVSILSLEEQSFDEFVAYNAAHNLLLPEEDGMLIDFKRAHLFYQLLNFYYSSRAIGENQQSAEEIFSKYFQMYENSFSELDKINCMQFLPKGSELITEKIKLVFEENQKVKLRERALINILIAQRAQNIAIEAYKEHFQKSYKSITGEDLQNDIQQQIEDEINRITL